MRTLKRVVLLLMIALIFDWSPDIPPLPGHTTAAVNAQQLGPGIFGPGGIMMYWASSSSAVNTVNNVNLYDYTIQPSWMATSSFLSGAGTAVSVNSVVASVPMHLHCNGKLSTGSSPGAFNVGVSLGPQTTAFGPTTNAQFATITLVAGITPQASLGPQVPMTIDVWLAPIATNAVPQSTDTFMNARLAYQNGTTLALASETVFSGQYTGGINLGVPNQLRVQWQWGTAGTLNAAVLHNCALIQGN